MTGFGRADAQLAAGALRAEVRSVNSRHLEVRVRLPRDFGALETRLRECAARFFRRGQIDLVLRLPHALESAAEVEIDAAVAARYKIAADELARHLGLEGGLPLVALLGLPGVARLRERELDPEAFASGILAVVESACAQTVEMREREGAALERELRARIASLLARLREIEARSGEVVRAQRERLAKRLAALAPELALDERRLEQEAVLYADRMDVTEEVVRLRSHCGQFEEMLAGDDGGVGRKLEFLLQEMLREANTIGSKASDAPIAREVIELKAELEKLREQVQNVE
jgi:uncharacterized protein (TIGR00255 family)